MQAFGNPAPAEQHHPQEAGFQEERSKHLIAQQRADHTTGNAAQLGPVGAELEGHDDAADHTHAERHRKDAQPEKVQPLPGLVVRAQPPPFQKTE